MAGRRAALFLRGINVGGRHKVTMADLRAILDDLDLGPSDTHLQSGNALISGRAGPKTDKRVAEALEAEFEFAVPAVSRSATELEAVVCGQPVCQGGRGRPQVGARSLPRKSAQAESGRLSRGGPLVGGGVGGRRQGHVRPLRRRHGPLEAHR